MIGHDDAGDGSREGAEAVAAVGLEGGDVEAGLEVEEADGAVGEAAGEVDVGEGEAAADDGAGVGVGDVGGVEVEGGVGVIAGGEVSGESMTVDELLVPRVLGPIGAAPDLCGETLPQQIRTRNCVPRRTYLPPFKSSNQAR